MQRNSNSSSNHRNEHSVSEVASTLAHLASAAGGVTEGRSGGSSTTSTSAKTTVAMARSSSGMKTTMRSNGSTSSASNEESGTIVNSSTRNGNVNIQEVLSREGERKRDGEGIKIPDLPKLSSANLTHTAGEYHGVTPISSSSSSSSTTSSFTVIKQKEQRQKGGTTAAGSTEEEAIPVADLIKEAVLRRLNRPEDIVKRNMFAVEGKSIKFPVKLMYLLDECKEYQHIISWHEDGLSFIIHDANAFELKVLPKIFKEARFSSFLRKLTRWGFMKKSTPYGIKFFQRKFQRGNYSLCIDISCCNKGSTIIRGRSFEASLLEQRAHRLVSHTSIDTTGNLSLDSNTSATSTLNHAENQRRGFLSSTSGGAPHLHGMQHIRNNYVLNNNTKSSSGLQALKSPSRDHIDHLIGKRAAMNGSAHDLLRRFGGHDSNSSIMTDQEQNLRLLNELATRNRATNSDQLERQIQDILRRSSTDRGLGASASTSSNSSLLNHHHNQRDAGLGASAGPSREQQEADLLLEIVRQRELNRANNNNMNPSPHTLLLAMLQQQQQQQQRLGNIPLSTPQGTQEQKYLELLRLLSGHHHNNNNNFDHDHDGNTNINSLLPQQQSNASNNHDRIHTHIMSSAIEGLISSQQSTGQNNNRSSNNDPNATMVDFGGALGEQLLRKQLIRQLKSGNLSPDQYSSLLQQISQYQQQDYSLPSNTMMNQMPGQLGGRGVGKGGPFSIDEMLNASQRGGGSTHGGGGSSGVVPNNNDPNMNLLLEMIRRRNQGA